MHRVGAVAHCDSRSIRMTLGASGKLRVATNRQRAIAKKHDIVEAAQASFAKISQLNLFNYLR